MSKLQVKQVTFWGTGGKPKVRVMDADDAALPDPLAPPPDPQQQRAAPRKAVDDTSRFVEVWQDPAVAAARSTRDAVRVDHHKVYPSLRVAFEVLGLPLTNFTKRRTALKLVRKAFIEGHLFELVPRGTYLDIEADSVPDPTPDDDDAGQGASNL